MNKKHLKDPGSAITHFIGMLMAIFAGIPLLIKAAHEPSPIYLISLTIYLVSMILLYAASTIYHSLDISEKVNKRLKKFDHMMISDLSACLKRNNRNHSSFHRMGHCNLRNTDQSILDQLSEMVLFCAVYRNGLDMCSRLYKIVERTFSRRIRMAFSRWYHLHHWRNYLRTETSNI